MICINNDPRGYKIKLNGGRKTYIAKDVEQILNTVKHYYMKPHDKNNCPLCLKR